MENIQIAKHCTYQACFPLSMTDPIYSVVSNSLLCVMFRMPSVAETSHTITYSIHCLSSNGGT